jgi:hypothetical protein
MNNKLVLLLLMVVISGCDTIRFVQYDQPGKQESINRWHHTVLNGLVEVSKPLDVSQICKNKAWTNITTERTAMNILVGGVSPSVPYLTLSVPWSNKVECFEVQQDQSLPQPSKQD